MSTADIVIADDNSIGIVLANLINKGLTHLLTSLRNILRRKSHFIIYSVNKVVADLLSLGTWTKKICYSIKAIWIVRRNPGRRIEGVGG